MSRKQPARPGRTVSPPAIEDRPAGSPGSRPGRPTRLILIGGAVLLVLVAVAVVLARPALEARFGGAPAGVGGRILLPTDTGLTVFDLAQRRDTPVMTAPPGQIVTSVAWSPDRKLIAYGFFHRRPGDPASVSEIYLVGADGSDPRVLAERDRPGAVLDTPVWSPDGREVYFSYFGQVSGKPIQRIERVTVATGERQTVVEDGYAPDVSPDGKSLLFLRDERAGSGLWLAPLAGGDPTSILPPGKYPTLAVPKFSPDGAKLAVAIMNVGTATAPSSDPLAWLLPPVAEAHGQPWDIWTFDRQGGDPHRLTQINADDPSPTWSPDGQYVAFWGGTGLFVVGADGSGLRQLWDKGGYGPIAWVP